MIAPAASGAFDLTGARVLVVGGASGIGAATAHAVAALGACTIVADIADGEPVAAAIGARGGSAHAVRCDVSDREAVSLLVDTVGDIDALVVASAICPWDNWDDAEWDRTFARVIAVNLLGPIHLLRAILPRMGARGSGRIVLVGSLAGKSGGLVAGPHYVASKGGLHALVKWAARRGGPQGVLVNGVAPASVRTPMMTGQRTDLAGIPLGRMAEPEEVAWPIAFLCCPASSFITGTVIDINGGVYMP